MSFNYLSAIVFLPMVGAIVIALLPGKSAGSIKRVALVFTIIPFILSLVVFALFNKSSGAAGLIQFSEKVSWIPAINAFYHLGVDGLNLPFVVLTAFLGFLVILVSWHIDLRPKEYFAWLLLLEGSILGVFAALDLLLFFLFWEIEVIPMYFLISIWGAGRREYSAIKYVIYTLFGSAMMLAGILSLYFTTGSLSMIDLANTGLAPYRAVIPAAAMFSLLLTGFAVKLPVFPVHTWLPDAHTDAPTAVSVMLAGALLKMGGYGMLRIVVGIFPDVAQRYGTVLVIFAVFTILYGAAVTLRQTDIKKLIAYSSVSHMGFVLLGIFALSQVSVTGAVLQMVSHGFIAGLLFAVAGLVMHNSHERDLSKLGGLARQIPFITVIFTLGGLGGLGLPGTSGFAAEFLVFIGSFSSNAVPGLQVGTILAVLGVVVGAGYVLWMIQRAFYGPVMEKFDGTEDAHAVDKIYMVLLVAAMLLIGIYPAILTDIIKVAVLPILR
ncbi:MAG: NADH-quinone oxidoreductase subunit M [Chloroflexi bacterium]|nr:NADH-quinone oxidoreductase subunit M [Chloroflexota bacterium]